MRIQPSQRQARAPRTEAPFKLHLELARGRSLGRRLLVGSAVAFCASLLAWAFGLPLPYHLAAVGVGFLGGATLPPRRAEDWALEWIEARAGLSYRTALEQPESDPYGFAEAVRARAEGATKRLEPPAAQPWWLPLGVLALCLALFPALNLPSLGTPFGAPGEEESALLEPPADPVPPPQEGVTPEGEAEAPPPTPSESPSQRQEAPENASEPDLARSFDTSGDAEGAGGAGAEQEALERYLDAVQNPRSSEVEERLGPSGSPMPGGGTGGGRRSGTLPPGSAPPEGSPAREPRQGAPPDQAEGASEGSEEAEGAPSETEGGQGQGQGQGQGREQGQAGQQPGSQNGAGNEGSPQGTQEAPPQDSSPAQDSAQVPQNEGAEASEGAAQEGGSSAPAEEAPGDGRASQEGSGAPGEGEGDTPSEAGRGDAEGAGNRGSSPVPGAEERLEGASEAPLERLPGQRGLGPINQGGEALTRGSDDMDIPNAQAPTDYERAAEEAVSEGRIPLEYQEILRDYFR